VDGRVKPGHDENRKVDDAVRPAYLTVLSLSLRAATLSLAATNKARTRHCACSQTGERGLKEDDMRRHTSRLDAADSLETKEDIAAYLDAVLEDGVPDLLKAALGDIARAKGMTEIAQAAGLGRANLYKALSPEGNPEFATVARVLKALGLRLSVAA
jgi:probable addiction module antidote protein